MNLKLLFPVYRSRYKWIEKILAKYAETEGIFGLTLSLGCGEGEGDPVVAKVSDQLIACDINPDDIAYAKYANSSFPNISYFVEDATRLSFPDNYFDLIVCSEVIEHVGQPEERLLAEIQRVLKPGKCCIFTFPTKSFPFTYDPINSISAALGRDRLIPWGAYAFGHGYLIDNQQFRTWCIEYHLEIVEEVNLCSYLASLTEIYWTGVLQSFFKKNASNQSSVSAKKVTYRPKFGDPFFGVFTDLLLRTDKLLFGKSRQSVLKGFVLRKKF